MRTMLLKAVPTGWLSENHQPSDRADDGPAKRCQDGDYQPFAGSTHAIRTIHAFSISSDHIIFFQCFAVDIKRLARHKTAILCLANVAGESAASIALILSPVFASVDGEKGIPVPGL